MKFDIDRIYDQLNANNCIKDKKSLVSSTLRRRRRSLISSALKMNPDAMIERVINEGYNLDKLVLCYANRLGELTASVRNIYYKYILNGKVEHYNVHFSFFEDGRLKDHFTRKAIVAATLLGYVYLPQSDTDSESEGAYYTLNECANEFKNKLREIRTGSDELDDESDEIDISYSFRDIRNLEYGIDNLKQMSKISKMTPEDDPKKYCKPFKPILPTSEIFLKF